MEDKIDLIKYVVDAYSINFHSYEVPLTSIDNFDAGIRSHLYTDYNFTSIKEQWEEICKDNHIYLIKDIFGVCYNLFRYHDEKRDSNRFIMIGPYLDVEAIDTSKMIKRLSLEIYHKKVLNDYYNGVPFAPNLDHIVSALIQSLSPNEKWEINHLELEMHSDIETKSLKIHDYNRLSSEMIEQRYEKEDAFLLAITQGDITKATLLMGEMSNLRYEAKTKDSLREAKNRVTTLNVLCRKAVQKARVHPAHIDDVSATIGARIEASRDQAELKKVYFDLIEKYCLLVQKYSLRGYSSIIENVINYIDFNFHNRISLNILAEKFSVNASYLSTQFKKEVGKTITEYITATRITHAQILLETTRLLIQEVGEKVGFIDENYFSKIFKKYNQMSPKAYRQKQNKPLN